MSAHQTRGAGAGDDPALSAAPLPAAKRESDHVDNPVYNPPGSDDEASKKPSGTAWWKIFAFYFECTPSSRITVPQFATYAVSWFLLWVPIGPCRIVLGDHTERQVVAGCLLGVLCAIVYFFMARFVTDRTQQYLGREKTLALSQGNKHIRLWKHDLAVYGAT